MDQELQGQLLAGWLLERCVGHGKSALVFKAAKDGKEAAVKVFDRELVERFGKPAQRERVQREQQLIGHNHPYLINILDAGEDTAQDLFFVAMEFFPGKNLAQVIPDLPADRIHPLLAQVASAAEFLETRSLAHRDIKPENIGVNDDFTKAVLLDLGVVRPVGLGNITDQSDQKHFVGTLQYSPPELLFREELDTTEGWRAVTFYQLGAVLYDMLTRSPLFAEYLTPYPRLVEAVRNRVPVIVAPNAPPDLILLSQNCLVKSPETRGRLVSWPSFQKAPAKKASIAAAQERIAQRLRVATSEGGQVITQPSPRAQLRALRELLETKIREIRSALDLFPPLTIHYHEELEHVCVRLLFAPSPERALTEPLVLYLDGVFLDNQANVIRIKGGALFDKKPHECGHKREDGQFAVLFEGVHNDELIHECLQMFMLLAIDNAQQACSQGSVLSSNPTWLSGLVEQIQEG